MIKYNLDACYISGTDPHMSEYLPERWQTRAFISGFTGSYGTVVVSQEEAGLWTDSRYFIQAEEQLRGAGMKMYKLRVPNAVPPEVWLTNNLTAGSNIGFDPKTISVSSYRELKSHFEKSGLNLLETPDLLDRIWKDRPEIPGNEIYELLPEITGLSRNEKQQSLAAGLKKADADFQVITALDELAWLFNLRGSDIAYNPVFTGFGVVGSSSAVLFAGKSKISHSVQVKLETEKIEIREYDEFYTWLKSNRNKTFFIDPATTNFAVFQALEKNNKLLEGTSIVAGLKAVKNSTELAGFHEAMKKDGAALVQFLFWLKNNLKEKKITEYTAGQKLAEFRAEQKGFKGESFAPIVGYKEHGAIVHYSATPENAFDVEAEGILLIDSGGQYLQGTTDITRTVALGKVSDEQKKDYTLVLKGMIALARAQFPEGTKGSHLDILARKALWENGLNYGHGTGHGVGHFLNVHEGPASIRPDFNPFPVQPGMVFSNEPGIYREGKYGIRIENLIVCTEKEETEFGKFYGFETLTLCPIDTTLIVPGLLADDEKSWLNNYHQIVGNALKPLLKKDLQLFLEELIHPV